MKLQLLVVINDKEYGSRLSSILIKKFPEKIQADVCSDIQAWQSFVQNSNYDCILMDKEIIEQLNLEMGQEMAIGSGELLLISCSPLQFQKKSSQELLQIAKNIKKYQRVSFLVQEFLSVTNVNLEKTSNTKLTLVWSPAGGTGKTTIALAYSAFIAERSKVVYLDLGYFSSIPAYFSSSNKGISWVFQQLEDTKGGIHLDGIVEMDTSTGIMFFGAPENYDDMNVLSEEHIGALLESLFAISSDVVIDLPSVCNERTQYLFEKADKILLVSDGTSSSENKLAQFITQHHIYGTYQQKITVVSNKGSSISWNGAQGKLPFVKSSDEKVVFKSLATQINF